MRDTDKTDSVDSIWKKNYSIDYINQIYTTNSILGHLGIKFTEIDKNCLKATMPVDHRTMQPLGILHGGASAVLAETLGSAASLLVLDDEHYSVGLEIKANHIRSVTKGIVTGIVLPIHIGRTTHIWDISIKDEQGRLVCISRLTLMIMKGRLPAQI